MAQAPEGRRPLLSLPVRSVDNSSPFTPCYTASRPGVSQYTLLHPCTPKSLRSTPCFTSPGTSVSTPSGEERLLLCAQAAYLHARTRGNADKSKQLLTCASSNKTQLMCSRFRQAISVCAQQKLEVSVLEVGVVEQIKSEPSEMLASSICHDS